MYFLRSTTITGMAIETYIAAITVICVKTVNDQYVYVHNNSTYYVHINTHT